MIKYRHKQSVLKKWTTGTDAHLLIVPIKGVEKEGLRYTFVMQILPLERSKCQTPNLMDTSVIVLPAIKFKSYQIGINSLKLTLLTCPLSVYFFVNPHKACQPTTRGLGVALSINKSVLLIFLVTQTQIWDHLCLPLCLRFPTVCQTWPVSCSPCSLISPPSRPHTLCPTTTTPGEVGTRTTNTHIFIATHPPVSPRFLWCYRGNPPMSGDLLKPAPHHTQIHSPGASLHSGKMLPSDLDSSLAHLVGSEYFHVFINVYVSTFLCFH